MSNLKLPLTSYRPIGERWEDNESDCEGADDTKARTFMARVVLACAVTALLVLAAVYVERQVRLGGENYQAEMQRARTIGAQGERR